MPILEVTKLLFGNNYIKKVPSKNIIFWAFCRHNKIKIMVHAHNIWAYVYIVHKSVIFGPIPKKDYILMLRR